MEIKNKTLDLTADRILFVLKKTRKPELPNREILYLMKHPVAMFKSR